MTEILLSGCCGKMGRAIASYLSSREDAEIAAGIDISDAQCGFPVFVSPFSYEGAADVIIDFSSPAALPGLLEYAVKRKIPAVIATTGLDDAHINLIHKAAQEIPVFFSANMSLGVSLVCELAKTAAKVLGDSFDIEIIEAHHNQKVDAPSGTALMIADAISGELEKRPVYEYNRHDKREKRTKSEIGIHSVRGGTIVGEHEVIFAGYNEVIKICHSAASKELFAAGAVNAAMFIKNKTSGLYSMSDIVSA